MRGYDRVKFFQRVEKVCVKAIIILSCVALVTPLVVRTDVLYMYIVGKIVAFRILVELIGGMWIFLCIFKKTYRPRWRDPRIASISVFMLVLVLSMFTSVDPYRSFWSYQERMMGVVTMLHLWVWFLALTSVLKNWSQWKYVLYSTLIANSVVGLYGIGQKFHLSFLLHEADPLRMAATLGNSIYLGGYALLHLFLSVFVFFRVPHNLVRLFCAFSVLLNAFMIIASGSRGPFLATLVGLSGVLAVVCWWSENRLFQIIIRRVIVAVGIGIIVLLIFFVTPFGKNVASDYLPSYAQRLLYQTFNDQARFALWEVGMKGFFARPLTGWGWSTYDYVNNTYIPEVTRVRITNPWNDQSHNQIVDVLAMSGIIGGAAYLSFWFFLFWCVVRSWRRSHSRASSLAVLFFLLLAYFLQNLTVFDNPATIIVFYCIAAFAYFFTREQDRYANPDRDGFRLKQERESRMIDEKLPFPQSGYPILLLCIAVPLSGIYWLNLSHYRVSQIGISALHRTERGDLAGGLKQFEELFARDSFVVPEFREQFVDLTTTLAKSGRYAVDTLRPFVERAVAESMKNVEEHPRNFRFVLRLLSMMEINQHFDPQANTQALEIAKKALKIHPNRYELYRSLAELSFLTGDTQQAIEYSKKALQLDQVKARSHWHLSIQYARSGMGDKALDEAWTAMMDDCYLYSYTSYVRSLADAFPKTDTARAQDFFLTLAAAYGRKDKTFIYAFQQIATRTQELQREQITSTASAAPQK